MFIVIKETLLIKDLKPALNENVGSEKALLPYVLRLYLGTTRSLLEEVRKNDKTCYAL